MAQYYVIAVPPGTPLPMLPFMQPEQPLDVVQNMKRKYEEEETPAPKYPYVDIRYLKDFSIEFDASGFSKLVSYIELDMPVVRELINKNIEMFTPFVRSGDSYGVMYYIDNILADVVKFQKFKICRDPHNCKFKECCAFMHMHELHNVLKNFKSVQHFTNRFIDQKAIYIASSLIKNIMFLEMSTWQIVSRKTLGNATMFNT